MVDRHCHHAALGCFWYQPDGHHHQKKRETFICGYLVLHSHVYNCSCVTCCKFIRTPCKFCKELFHVCRSAGCPGTMVVWTQCCGFFPDNSLPGINVLFYSQSCEQTCILIPSFNHTFLGPYLSLHLGRTSSPALHIFTRLGTITWNRFFNHAIGTFMGRNDKRITHLTRGMG